MVTVVAFTDAYPPPPAYEDVVGDLQQNEDTQPVYGN